MENIVEMPFAWLTCPSQGNIIQNIFIPFKTLLDKRYNEEISLNRRFNANQMNKIIVSHNIKMIIDLTTTSTYYNPRDLAKASHVKLFQDNDEGFPSPEHIRKFIEYVRDVINYIPEAKIGVHCIHGFNMTGFMIVSYLVMVQKMGLDQALEIFAQARPPGIFAKEYIVELQRRFDPRSSYEVPEEPYWYKTSLRKKKVTRKPKPIRNESVVESCEIATSNLMASAIPQIELDLLDKMIELEESKLKTMLATSPKKSFREKHKRRLPTPSETHSCSVKPPIPNIQAMETSCNVNPIKNDETKKINVSVKPKEFDDIVDGFIGRKTSTRKKESKLGPTSLQLDIPTCNVMQETENRSLIDHSLRKSPPKMVTEETYQAESKNSPLFKNITKRTRKVISAQGPVCPSKPPICPISRSKPIQKRPSIDKIKRFSPGFKIISKVPEYGKRKNAENAPEFIGSEIAGSPRNKRSKISTQEKTIQQYIPEISDDNYERQKKLNNATVEKTVQFKEPGVCALKKSSISMASDVNVLDSDKSFVKESRILLPDKEGQGEFLHTSMDVANDGSYINEMVEETRSILLTKPTQKVDSNKIGDYEIEELLPDVRFDFVDGKSQISPAKEDHFEDSKIQTYDSPIAADETLMDDDIFTEDQHSSVKEEIDKELDEAEKMKRDSNVFETKTAVAESLNEASADDSFMSVDDIRAAVLTNYTQQDPAEADLPAVEEIFEEKFNENKKKNLEFVVNIKEIVPVSHDSILESLRKKLQNVFKTNYMGFTGQPFKFLTWKNLDTLVAEKENMFHTWRTDGRRYLLFLGLNNEAYFIDENNSYYTVSNFYIPHYADPNGHLTQTVFDGEFVIDHVGNQTNYIYLIANVYAIEGKVYKEEKMSVRLATIQNITTVPMSHMTPCEKNKLPFQVGMKMFLQMSHIKHVWNELRKQVPHKMTGLTFYPYSSPRYFNIKATMGFLWIPPESKTIDFLFEVDYDKSEKRSVGNLMVRGRRKPYAQISNLTEVEMKKFDRKIVKCQLNTESNLWYILREETRKIHPVSNWELQDLIDDISHPITFDELVM